VMDLVGEATSALADRGPLAELHGRVRASAIDLADLVMELRTVVETWEEDPERLEQVRERRQVLHTLCRKYGDSLAEVLNFAEAARKQLDALLSMDERAAQTVLELAAAERVRDGAAMLVGKARRKAAPGLGSAIAQHLHELAMPLARFEVTVGDDDPGDEVTFLLGANPGEPALPLGKVASGGELARTMLAVQLVLSAGPGTLVFDEVDAGIGGEAALAVGASLARLAREHQVVVVTHLPQVAAFANQQVVVRKHERNGRTVSEIVPLARAERVVELSRMLSGHPDSAAARQHAQELLAIATERRDRS